MNEHEKSQTAKRSGMWWATPASVLFHVLVAAILILRLPAHAEKPPAEEPIKVEIVKPEEAEKAKPNPPPKPPASSSQQQNLASANIPIPALRPVFQFGEKASGAEQSLQENASDGKKDGSDSLKDQSPDVAKADKPVPTTDKSAASKETDALPGVSDILTAKTETAKDAIPIGKPKEQTASAKDPAKDSNLQVARKLYSDNALGGAQAIAAMGDIPRDARIAKLCSTELREQLLHSDPPYNPLLVPQFRIRSGNLMIVPQAAFFAESQWVDVSFRCEVDDNATKVTGFALQIGQPVPKDQWKARGFPG